MSFMLIFCVWTRGLIMEAILAITAIIVLWYAYETSLMRKELTKQNVLLIRPVITLSKNLHIAYYYNRGAGVALDITLKVLKRGLVIDKDVELKNDIDLFEIPTISVLFKNEKEEIKIFRKNPRGTKSEADLLFEKNKKIVVVIKYKDFEKTEYMTTIRIENGTITETSFG